jgi:hypothetical protein
MIGKALRVHWPMEVSDTCIYWRMMIDARKYCFIRLKVLKQYISGANESPLRCMTVGNMALRQ